MSEIKNQVLDRWAMGEGAGFIARTFGRDAAWVRLVVRAARSMGDPRAVSHADAVAGTEKWCSRFARSGIGWEFRDAHKMVEERAVNKIQK